MEGVGHVEAFAEAVQPDLLEAFADREITLFGITGTFKDLAEMCPVDLHDPSITLEAKNEFVVKAANEAGVEIEPKHEAIFTEIAEKHGLEPKFKVVQPNEVAEKPVEQPTKSSPDAATAVEVYNEQVRQRVELAHAENNVATKPAKRTLKLEQSQVSTRESHTPLTTPTVTKSVAPPPNTEPVSSKNSYEAAVAVPNVKHFEAAQDVITESIEVSTLPEIPLPPVSVESHVSAQSAEVAWGEELAKDPGEMYDNFVSALEAFEGVVPLAEHTNEFDFAYEQLDTEVAILPEVVGVVAQRLNELEPNEKEAAAQILKNIVGAIHGLKLLEARDAGPEHIEVVEAQLRELCVTLFEAIGIEYSEQDIEEFMSVLLHKNFQPVQPTEHINEYIDLEHQGTREAKSAVHAAGGRVVRTQLKQMIGMFAVLRHISFSSMNA